jgi:predicted lactoylglutathione lyase
MTPMMFVNLPIENLKRSVDFYTALGFEFNPQFTSEDSTCMLVNENCFVMLLEKQRFAEFVDKEIADNTKTVSALFALSFESADAVQEFCEKAFALGARKTREPQDLGFMFSWAFEDLDGHIIEPFWMDPAAVG